MARYLYSELASAICARRNCDTPFCVNCNKFVTTINGQMMSPGTNHPSHTIVRKNQEWFDKWTARIKALVSEHMPSGSGFDNGTKLDLDASHAEKLVFTTSFHHMHESGMYDGWTEHVVTVTPSFIGGFNLRISGRNRNDIKEYIADQFHYALSQEITTEVQ